MPLVENSPKTELELKASLEMSATVWLYPMDLTESINPRAEYATPFELRQVGVIDQPLTSDDRRCTEVWHDPTLYSCVRCLRRGASLRGWPPHYPKEVRGDEAHRFPNLRCWHVPEPKLQSGIFFRLSPKTAAEVSYNPPSHSLSDLPGRPPPAQNPHQ